MTVLCQSIIAGVRCDTKSLNEVVPLCGNHPCHRVNPEGLIKSAFDNVTRRHEVRGTNRERRTFLVSGDRRHVLHEFPEGIITDLLLACGGLAECQTMLLAFIAAATSPALGMLVPSQRISAIDRETLGALVALSAGALVYLGDTHLLPRAEQEQKRFSLVALAGEGVVVIIIVASHA